ncbi:murein hydrolase activator EnvC family protein [Marinicauda salina]|nr:peptidoglycan DD-metalloendopeptidase family protein [Marinicauda salina]
MPPFVLVAALLAQPADAPDPERIEALEAEAEETREQSEARAAEADALAAEIAELQARLVQAAERVRAAEASADTSEARLAELEAEEAALSEQLARERESLARVLAALQRFELADPPALAVTPDDAAEAARAAGLMARIAPMLEARAANLARRLEELAALRAELGDQRETVAEARARLAETRAEVSDLLAERRAAEQRLRAEAADLSDRAAEIASRARSLRELLAEIRRFADAEPRLAPRRTEPPDPSGVPVPRVRPERRPVEEGELMAALPVSGPAESMRFSDVRGRLRPPAGGRIVSGAGERGPDGVVREGVWFETRSRAQVTAPFDGVVVYAGPFQSFDGVLMINTADGYTLIIGGMALVYAAEGQSVLAGEPVGAMPDRENPPPRLYLEIRRNSDEADDPEMWLRPEFRRG